MGIYLRGSTWWYCIEMKGRKPERKSCKTKDKQAAQEYHDKRRVELWRQVRLGEKPRRTWDEAVTRWLRDREGRDLRSDRSNLPWWGERFSDYGIVYLDEITPDLVAEIRDEELARKSNKGAGKIKPGSVNRKISTLRSVVNSACRLYLWLDRAPLFKKLSEPERIRWLTEEEVGRLIAAVPEFYRPLVVFALATGLRRGNITGLKWEYVNMVERTITLPDIVMKNGRPLTIPINEIAVQVIRKQLGQHQEYVFCRKDGEPSHGVPYPVWSQALEEAGITDFRFHDLRHTWASLLRQNGVGLDKIQQLGGWLEAKMVQRYAHICVNHLKASAAVIDDVLERGVQILHRAA